METTTITAMSNAELLRVISEQETIIKAQSEEITRLSELVALLENDRSET